MSMIKSEVVPYSSLSPAHQDLIQRAMHVKDSAYSRYSHFSVGSAVLTSTGKTYKGCNVDNSSHSLNTCAERAAVTHAVSEGDKTLTAIAVVFDQEKGFPSPCGACRQIIAEFGYHSNCTVLLVKTSTMECLKTTIRDMLPRAFLPESLHVS